MLLPFQNYVETQGVECLRSRDENGNTVCHWVCLGGQTTMLRYMIEVKGPVDDPSDNDLAQHPIHWACVNGHIGVVDILLQAGVSIDSLDGKGCTPLTVACQYGKTVLAGYLMGRGASLQITDKDGDTPLHWACFKGNHTTNLFNKINFTASNFNKWLVLISGFSELSRLLIYSGFSAHQRDNYGQTPLHLACISGDLTCVMELCEQVHMSMES